MIANDVTVFPNNVILLMAAAYANIDPDITVLKRPLRSSDPNLSVGVFGSLWDPEEESLEIGHSTPREPTLAVYQLATQVLIKDAEEESGLAIHSVLSKRIRTVLYRSEALRLGLESLSVTDGSSVERTRRWGIRTQRYMNNDIDGQFVYVSTMEHWLETETL